MWRKTLGGALYLSLIPKTGELSVLDVGTGTGIWAIEFAEEHPTARVLGTDLSPIQPEWVPTNCKFEVDNAEADWVYNEKFDFIHGRMLCLGIHDWPRFFRQCWDHLKPGGWLEVQEVTLPIFCDDGSAAPDSALLKWGDLVKEAALKGGIDAAASNKFSEMLRAQGFVVMREEPIKWAVGHWPKGKLQKEIGAYTHQNILQALNAVTMALFTKQLGWSREAAEMFLVEARKDINDSKKHCYCRL